ncbi:MAG: hypothetical protein KDB22_15175 [Planctomycetales bacterium]|nr:hypothetical protein [Planctomycetales bacterium]
MGRQTGLVLIDRSQAFSPSVALLCVALRGLALRGFAWLGFAWLGFAWLGFAWGLALRGLALRGVDYHSTHRDSALAAGKCPGYR